MSGRMYSRRPNGRFQRATMANTFGLTIYVCKDCRRMNPVAVNAPKPDECHACGSSNLE